MKKYNKMTQCELIEILEMRDKKIAELFRDASHQIAEMTGALGRVGDTLNDIYTAMYPGVKLFNMSTGKPPELPPIPGG